jgi:hypothetical protein
MLTRSAAALPMQPPGIEMVSLGRRSKRLLGRALGTAAVTVEGAGELIVL